MARQYSGGLAGKTRLVDRQSRRAIGLAFMVSPPLAAIVAMIGINGERMGIGGVAVLASIGFLALLLSIRGMLAILRTGDGILLIDDAPIRAGEVFRARFETRATERQLRFYRAEMTCTLVQPRQVGRRRIWKDQVLWSQPLALRGTKTPGSPSRTYALGYDIPAQLPGTSSNDGHKIVWQIRIETASPDAQGPLFSWGLSVLGSR